MTATDSPCGTEALTETAATACSPEGGHRGLRGAAAAAPAALRGAAASREPLARGSEGAALAAPRTLAVASAGAASSLVLSTHPFYNNNEHKQGGSGNTGQRQVTRPPDNAFEICVP